MAGASSDFRFPELGFVPGKIVRKFLTVPADATWVDFIVSGRQTATFDGKRQFFLHAVLCLCVSSLRCFADWLAD